MIKKIDVNDLTPGMYIHDLNCDWMNHPFLRNSFMLKNGAELGKIFDAGVHEVYIDTDKGLDVANAPTEAEIQANLTQEMIALAASEPGRIAQVALEEEMARARNIRGQAHKLVRDVMSDVRLGKAVQLEAVEGMVENITGSILRNSGALVGLLRIKSKDDYTFLHSVSVCALMVTFGRSLGLDTALVRQAGLGGLLHDVGKAKVPDEILNKPGRLTDDEFEIIKLHPGDGHAVLLQTPGVGEIPLDITRHHHERMDASGYPDKLPGDQISMMAQMAAIVDVYDAITADRCYHKGIPPTEALRKIWEWSKFHFNPQLVQGFMRCVGIYPTGSLVRLESGRLAVVMQQNAVNMLQPKVKAIFSTKSNAYIPPVMIDLSRSIGAGGADAIVGHEDPLKLGIDTERFFAV